MTMPDRMLFCTQQTIFNLGFGSSLGVFI